MEYWKVRNCEGHKSKVFVVVHWFLLHFVNDEIKDVGGALEATQNVRWAEFKKPSKT